MFFLKKNIKNRLNTFSCWMRSHSHPRTHGACVITQEKVHIDLNFYKNKKSMVLNHLKWLNHFTPSSLSTPRLFLPGSPSSSHSSSLSSSHSFPFIGQRRWGLFLRGARWAVSEDGRGEKHRRVLQSTRKQEMSRKVHTHVFAVEVTKRRRRRRPVWF